MRDVAAIIRLTHDYAFANDRFDVEAVVGLFLATGTFDMTAFGMRRYEGVHGLRAYFEKEARVLSHLMHVTSNHRVDVDGDTATGTAYFIAIAVTHHGNENQARGYYEDRYARTEAGWRFASRITRPLVPYASVREDRGAATE
jgi:ketosteroid isomerase-like protein